MQMRQMSKLPINLTDLLYQRTVEDDRIEYKAGWNPDAIVRTLVRLRQRFRENLGGGYIVIGQDCDANGQPVFPPVGVPSNRLDKIQRELLAYCNLIQPPYFPMLSPEACPRIENLLRKSPFGQISRFNSLNMLNIRLIESQNLTQNGFPSLRLLFSDRLLEEFEGRNLIVLWAPGGQNRPYKAPAAVTAKHKVYQYFIRRYSSTVEARGADERELFSLTATVPFDDRYHQNRQDGAISRHD